MSKHVAKPHVLDMLDAIERIQKYLEGVDVVSFAKREMVFDAVTLNFEVLGESSARIEPMLKEAYPDLPWNQLRGLRNRIAHGYTSVKAEQLYFIAQEHLPALRHQLQRILSQLS